MVNIACVSVGNYRGMGARYVNALFRGCSRNLTVPFQFICLTDDAGGLLPGIQARIVPQGLIPSRLHPIYTKLALFRPSEFPSGARVLYLDLDMVVTGNIDAVASYSGPFAMLRDPACPSELNSSIMAWGVNGSSENIWTKWVDAGQPDSRLTDQSWIADMHPDAIRLQDVFPGRLRSFKAECLPPRNATFRRIRNRLFGVPYPDGAAIVYFHASPKPDNCPQRWVQAAWA